MGSGGGGMVAPGPSAGEQQQILLQNQLLQQQLADSAKQREGEAYKQTPAYLNQQLSATRGKQQQDYNTNKTKTYQTARQQIIDQFNAFGDPNAATPYLQALDSKYNSLQYRPGGDYGTTTSQSPGRVALSRENYNEEQFLRDNPDVANSYGFGNGDRSYYQSGRDYLDRNPDEWNKRTVSGMVTNSATVAPQADSWDDYTTLLNNDFGANDYITQQRQVRKDNATNTARSQAWNYLDSLGLDANTTEALRQDVARQFETRYNTAGLSANDYSNVFDPKAIIDSATGTLTTAKRGQYTTQANRLFSGVDPNKDFGDDADDPYISDLVGKQYNDAYNALDRARKRGALTDQGFTSGASYLGDQNKTALSSAQSLGGAVLAKNRDALSSVKNNALTGASNYTLGQSFDANDFLNQYGTKKASLAGSLGGDITNALAGQNWFDVGDVLTKAGYAQGAQNTAALTDGFSTPAMGAIQQQRDKDKGAMRGLGGTGVF